MKLCALRCAPQDAVPEILAVANYICKNKGGQGCVREVIEMVLKSQNNWHLF
jgi:3-deoxy-D-manno-octulosonate 8-phosphate phosphatase (KDO 8-P phosphatase)